MRYASVSVAQLESWSKLNDSKLLSVKIEPNIIVDGVDRGGGLVATSPHGSEDVLVDVANDLILTRERALLEAKTDKHLRELLDALSDFIQIPRRAVLVFLLYQVTISSPDNTGSGVGVHSAFTDYVKTLPKHYSLPTFFTDAEYEALEGTSLHDAVTQKRVSLQQEFEELKSTTGSIEWCQRIWWSEGGGMLRLSDWTMVDAMYRSRALDLPQGIGAAMVPLIDMANHMPDDLCNARFEVDSGQRVQLLTQEGRQIRAGDEITINYGPGGACESIFSYGFLEEQARSARELFLSLTIPADDPLRAAKMHYSQAAPGVRVYIDERGDARFQSDMALWASINEEDGLAFELSQTTDGGMEVQAVWNSAPLAAERLRSVVDADPRAPVFALRAAVMVQERVERQGELLSMTQDGVDQTNQHVPDDRKYIYSMIQRLRELELQLLMESYGAVEMEKQRLLTSPAVVSYLSGRQADTSDEVNDDVVNNVPVDEDFS